MSYSPTRASNRSAPSTITQQPPPRADQRPAAAQPNAPPANPPPQQDERRSRSTSAGSEFTGQQSEPFSNRSTDSRSNAGNYTQGDPIDRQPLVATVNGGSSDSLSSTGIVLSTRNIKITAMIIGIGFVAMSLIGAVMGLVSIGHCPASPGVPICLTGGSVTCVILACVVAMAECRSWRVNYIGFQIVCSILTTLIFLWFIGGSYAVFGHNFSNFIVESPTYCDRTVYLYMLVMLVLSHLAIINFQALFFVCTFFISEEAMLKWIDALLVIVTVISPDFRTKFDETRSNFQPVQ